MPEAGNPYIPGQPVQDPSLFFGRREAIAWARDNLVRGRGLLLICGAPRMGKTSLLHQLPSHLPDTTVIVRLDLVGGAIEPHHSPARQLAAHVVRELASERLYLDPRWADWQGDGEGLLREFGPLVRSALGDRMLVFLLDDADRLIHGGSSSLRSLVQFLDAWHLTDDKVACVLSSALGADELAAQAGLEWPTESATYRLGPLSSDDAVRLVTDPVQGVIAYDYGVARRLVELAAGQPYYLHLMCSAIYDRCVAAEWVNHHDVDVVVAHLVQGDLEEFRQVWDQSSLQEQAALAALVSLKVSRGVATTLEVHTELINAGVRVEREQVTETLERLAARGILNRLGALSYRFRVALLAEWLRERVDLATLARGARWPAREHVPNARPGPEPLVPKSIEKLTPPATTVPRRVPGLRPSWMWLGIVIAAGLVLLGSYEFLRAPSQQPATPGLGAGPTVLPRQSAQPAESTAPVTVVTASPTPPLPATSTSPVVVSRPVPAIAYQSRLAGSDVWSIYVMDSQGGNPLRLTDDRMSALTPAWSPDGSRIAFASDMDGNLDIWVMNRDGSDPVNLTRHRALDSSPAWSPDGQWIAFASVRDSPYWELYVMRPDGSDVQRLTWWEDASDLSPAWSPDGSRLAFVSKRDGNLEIYVMGRDGKNPVRLTNDPADDTSPAWSPDGSQIAFVSTRAGYTDIFLMPAGGGRAINLTDNPRASDHGPTWSPDGSRIAFFSDRGGDWDIYVMAADGSDSVRLTGDGTEDWNPAWRP